MKVSLEGVNKTIWIVVLIGVLVGTFSPLVFFNLNHSLAVYVMYPIVALFIGTLGYILVRKHWAGPIITLVGGIY
ncbi:hypothetical protein RWE15_16045 [Virgibacillus halophilus]|uniref:Uncharacterized protein n=1 Tax=Tigheibacillus halophilus TaxID=361280 RepID=A0ABU5C8J5_9BACI|nr:hypothetical protein [Virgibacillus halophilus]